MERSERMSNGDAMRWNEDVERRRREYHEHRCAEDALYRRAYERQQKRLQSLRRQTSRIADAMHTERLQRINNVTEDAGQQSVRRHEEIMCERTLMEARNTGFIGFAVAAMMFADGEKMKRQIQEMEEERPYLEEINRIDAQFDNEIIQKSGFEW